MAKTQFRTGQIGTSGDAWQNWSPTLNNLTLGNGTVVAQYIQIGKTVHFRFKLTFGTTTSMTGAFSITPPSTANANAPGFTIGNAQLTQTGTDNYFGVTDLTGTTAIAPVVVQKSATNLLDRATVNATTPFTWASTHVISMYGTYEAA